MRLTILALIILSLATAAVAQDKYVLPNRSDTPIYENANNSAAVVSKVSKDDRLQVMKESGSFYRVKTPTGKIGYVEKRKVSQTEGKAYTFDNIEVEGYLDNPTPIYITDMDDGQNAPIDLDRSFAETLKRNADKERVMRLAN